MKIYYLPQDIIVYTNKQSYQIIHLTWNFVDKFLGDDCEKYMTKLNIKNFYKSNRIKTMSQLERFRK